MIILLLSVTKLTAQSNNTQIPVDGIYDSKPTAKVINMEGNVLETVRVPAQRIMIKGTRVTVVIDINNNGRIDNHEIQNNKKFNAVRRNNMILWLGKDGKSWVRMFYSVSDETYYMISDGPQNSDRKLLFELGIVKKF